LSHSINQVFFSFEKDMQKWDVGLAGGDAQ
jgi:hypothetical protein